MEQNYISYGKFAKFLHWTMAALILLNYFLGLTLDKTSLYNFHKQTGLTILLLLIIRVVWRLTSRYPESVKSLSKLEQFAAKMGHLGLYGFMLAIPISGILMVDSYGYELKFWGLFTLPSIISAQSASASEVFSKIHEILANAMIALVAAHVLAALKHHIFDKNEVLLRMIPFGGKKK
jgi:cytochrome b561